MGVGGRAGGAESLSGEGGGSLSELALAWGQG